MTRNIDADPIICDYDGGAKHRTTNDVGTSIGSDASLVASVTVGDGAIVLAGRVITEDVEANALVIARGRQITGRGHAAATRAAMRETR